MSKTDKSKHGLCIAAIRRNTVKPYDFKWTKFYKANSDFSYSGIQLELEENELLICSTIIDSENYSILTTQRLITKENGIKSIGNLDGVSKKSYGNIKGFGNIDLTFGLVRLENGADLKYFIETREASMVMVYGIKMLIEITSLTDKNVENLTRVWNRQSDKFQLGD